MDSRGAIKMALEMSSFVALGYLQDLSDEQLMQRPHPDCNHINWQIGHLITAENQLINQVKPGAMPPLPAGFSDKYTKDTAKINDPKAFVKKDELLKLHAEQRKATFAALEKTTDDEFDKPTGVHYASTVAAMFSLQASHWLMHSGQWVIVRRQNGLPPLF